MVLVRAPRGVYEVLLDEVVLYGVRKVFLLQLDAPVQDHPRDIVPVEVDAPHCLCLSEGPVRVPVEGTPATSPRGSR